MIVNALCEKCLSDKWLAKCPGDDPRAGEYRRRVGEIVSDKRGMSSPEKDAELRALYEKTFDRAVDYGPIKRHFNALLMAMEPDLYAAAMAAPDPLKRAVQYAMTGNFIDFAAMDSVDEDVLRRRIAEADAIPVDGAALDQLRASLQGARRLAFLLDNCGEILMDRVLMRVIRQLNPEIAITAVVKGGPAVNDATREDAGQARLFEVAAVADTGCAMAGAPEGRLSAECRRVMAEADMLIAKGQANYETLCGCGLNIYYVFMCKCRLFTERFGVPRFGGVIVREKGA